MAIDSQGNIIRYSTPLPAGTWIRFMRGGVLVISNIQYARHVSGDMWVYTTDSDGEVGSQNVLEHR